MSFPTPLREGVLWFERVDGLAVLPLRDISILGRITDAIQQASLKVKQ